MPTNNDQVMKKRKRKPPSKTVNEFTSKDWDRYKSGQELKELRKDLGLVKRLATEAMKKQPAMEGKQVQDYMLCPQTERTQETFDAGKLVLLRDLRIMVKRELGYVPIALGGDGSPWLMKGKDGPPAIPEPWELRDGTGDSPIERHIAAEHEEIEWANKYLDGLFALFQEGIGSEGVRVSRIPFTRFYIYQVCPVFSRMETRISGKHYDSFYEKWYIKLSVLSVEMREFEARTREVKKEQTQEASLDQTAVISQKIRGRKRSERVRQRRQFIRNQVNSGVGIRGHNRNRELADKLHEARFRPPSTFGVETFLEVFQSPSKIRRHYNEMIERDLKATKTQDTK